MCNTIVGAGAASHYGSGSGSDHKLRLLAAPAPAPQHCIHICYFVPSTLSHVCCWRMWLVEPHQTWWQLKNSWHSLSSTIHPLICVLVVRCGWQDHIRADGWCSAVGIVPSTLSYVFLQAVVGRTISELMAGTEQLISCTIHTLITCVFVAGCGW
jgi:hypothetical protein